jgi:fibronectin type 3 domain-containing protein
VSTYEVFRGATSGDLAKIATVTATTFTNTLLDPKTTYYYELVAIDAGNDSSPASSEVMATTQ